MEIYDIPRPEYPRPQFVRDKWMNLNGTWQFFMDMENTGRERKLFLTERFLKEIPQEILVPFCPESRLSGIGYTDFFPAVWYRRTVELGEDCLSGRTLLHFGAVNFHAVVWVNGQQAGEHSGGYASFSLDVTKLLHPGENELIVYAENNVRSRMQPCGKQALSRESQGTSYTRTTGIWQTVSVPQRLRRWCRTSRCWYSWRFGAAAESRHRYSWMGKPSAKAPYRSWAGRPS